MAGQKELWTFWYGKNEPATLQEIKASAVFGKPQYVIILSPQGGHVVNCVCTCLFKQFVNRIIEKLPIIS